MSLTKGDYQYLVERLDERLESVREDWRQSCSYCDATGDWSGIQEAEDEMKQLILLLDYFTPLAEA